MDLHQIPQLVLWAMQETPVECEVQENTHGMGRWKVRVELPRSQQGGVGVIHEEMVAQRRAGVKVRG